MARTIAIITHKGGTLKTSLVANIAGVLSQRKKSKGLLAKKTKILIVDMDGQGNAGMSFGFKPDLDFTINIYDVLLEDVNIKKAIKMAHKNIDIVGANTDMISFELNVLAIKKIPSERYFNLLSTALEPVKSNYDYILIDSPASLGLIAGNILSASDDVLIPFHPEPYSMQSVVTILKQIKEFKDILNKNLNILGIVGTLVDRRTSLHSTILTECRQYASEIGITVFDTVIPRTIRFSNSVAYKGKPATITDKNNPYVKAYFDLVDEMNI